MPDFVLLTGKKNLFQKTSKMDIWEGQGGPYKKSSQGRNRFIPELWITPAGFRFLQTPSQGGGGSTAASSNLAGGNPSGHPPEGGGAEFYWSPKRKNRLLILTLHLHKLHPFYWTQVKKKRLSASNEEHFENNSPRTGCFYL